MSAFTRSAKDPRPLRPGSAIADGDPAHEEIERREALTVVCEAIRRALDGMDDQRNATLLKRYYGVCGEEQHITRGGHLAKLSQARAQARECLEKIAVAV